MAEALIKLLSRNINYDELTAIEADVFDKATFVGADSETIREGSGINRGSPKLSLPLNGSVTLPEGKYEGGEVYQSISTMDGWTAYPGSKEITIPTKDVYMTRDILVSALPNLRPENIKEGEYVGGVGPGTWKGYVIEDQRNFYYRGTFAPGQSLEDYVNAPYEESYKLKRTNTDRDIQFYAQTGRGKSNWCVFSSPIDLTGIKRLKIQVLNKGLKYASDSSDLWIGMYRNKYISEPQSEQPVVYKSYNFTSANNERIENLELDLSSYSRNAYLNLSLNVKLLGYMCVRIIQFE